MPKKIFNSDLETSGEVKATSVIADTATISGGYIAAGTLTDGTATLSGGVLTASTLTDGTATISGGVLTASTLADGTATLSGGVLTTNHVVAPLIEASPDTDLNLRSDDSVVITIDYDEDAVEAEDYPAYYVKLRTAPNTDTYLMDINQFYSHLRGNLDGELFLVNGYSSLRSSGNVELGIDTGNNNSTEKFIVYRGANSGSDSGAVELLKVSAAETSISASTISLAASYHLALDAPTASLTGLLEEPLRVGSDGTNVVCHINANDELALGSVNRLQGLHPMNPGVTVNGGQDTKYLYLGSDRDTVSIQSEEVYMFRDAGVAGSNYSVADITDTSAYFADLSGYTRGLTWVPPGTVGLPSQLGGRVLVASTTNFTGVHRYLSSSELSIGDAVELTGDRISRATTANSTICAGIVCFIDECSIVGDRTSLGEDLATMENPVVYVVAAVGDSRHLKCQGFNVCNENGDIQPGDLLVTSSTPGYLMKQDDDIIRSKTVGKAMEAVTFDDNGQATGVYGFIYCG